MKIKIENGEVKIDVYELLEELTSNERDEEQLGEMYNALCWYHPVYKELIGTTRNTFASDNTNVKFYKLFKDFFMMPEEYGNDPKPRIVMRMTQVMKQILEDNANSKAGERLATNVPFKIFPWLESQFGTDAAWKIRSKLLDEMKTENGKTVYDIADEMSKQTPYKDFVKEWVDAVYEMMEIEKECE